MVVSKNIYNFVKQKNPKAIVYIRPPRWGYKLLAVSVKKIKTILPYSN